MLSSPPSVDSLVHRIYKHGSRRATPTYNAASWVFDAGQNKRRRVAQPHDIAGMAEGEQESDESLGNFSVFLGQRCTRVHFVRHAEGTHNVAARAAGVLAKEEVDHLKAKHKEKAIADGKSSSESEAIAEKAGVSAMRTLENKPVHFDTQGADQFTDAQLTESGQDQCFSLRGKIDRNHRLDPLHQLHIDLVVVSPLRRCLETADLIFGPGRCEEYPDGVPFLVHDLCRERYGEFYCDKRLPMSETKEDSRWTHWDWDTQKSSMPDDVMPYSDTDVVWTPEREPEAHVRRRAVSFLKWLSNRPEDEVAVVTHSSFMKHMFAIFTGEASPSVEHDRDVLRAVPANCELRTVVLCHHGED
jgi:broad specificity phosphatase PhoE